MPESIRWLALFSPAFHLNQLVLSIGGATSVLGPSGAIMHVAALAGVTILFAGLAARNLSLEPKA